MELRKFVTEVLLEIANGVTDAQQQQGSARINPSNLSIGTDLLRRSSYNGDGEVAQAVEFDVAITISNATAAVGK